jgi:hypothetical protein
MKSSSSSSRSSYNITSSGELPELLHRKPRKSPSAPLPANPTSAAEAPAVSSQPFVSFQGSWYVLALSIIFRSQFSHLKAFLVQV